MELPRSLQGEKWTQNIARKLLPLLVSYAEARRSVTYGELSEEAVRRKWCPHRVMPLAYRYPAGAIGFAIEETEKVWKEPIPPINTIIINQKTGLPGKGADYFIRNYLRKTGNSQMFTEDQRRSIINEINKCIFNYPSWERLLEYYQLPGPPSLKKSQIAPKQKWNNKKNGEPESEAHKSLKQLIANSPWLVDLPRTTPKGQIEYRLPSADEIDILFQCNSSDIAIEVKASNANDDDLLRGIYQCVKYRALLKAQQRVMGAKRRINAYLVTEGKLRKRDQRTAEILNVKWKRVNPIEGCNLN